MSETRPSLARAHTRATEGKRSSELDRGVRFRVDEDVYEVRLGDLSALDSLVFRKAVGIPFAQVLTLADEDGFDIDLLAALMWMARRVAGERNLTFEEVASEVGYADLERVSPMDDSEDPTSPEA